MFGSLNFSLLLLLAFLAFDGTKAELRIRPPGSGPENSIYVLSIGSRLELECQLDRGDFSGTDDVNALDWMRGKLRIAHNWLSMYTQSKVDDQGRWIRQTLVIPRVDEQSVGEYKCLFYDDQQRTIQLHVLETLNWRTTTDKPGGPVDQPLTIDCGADGVPDDVIKILDHRGRAIEESNGEVLVAGADVTIPRLGMQHKGMKIRCVAIRRIRLEQFGVPEGGPDSFHTDERELTVDVWVAPKFDTSEVASAYYAVPGSKQVLRWTIIESNPPVKSWTLRKDGRQIGGTGNGRIQIVQQMDDPKPLFAISIEEVQDDDYGRYTLTVHNGKLESEQTLSLVVTQPPGQPRVNAEWVSSNGSVSWRVLEQQNQGQLPVTYFWIIYKPIKRIQQSNQSATKGVSGEAPQQFMAPSPNAAPLNSTAQTYRLRRRRNPNNLYDIAGLDPYTEYEFTFVAGNQAGESDPLAVKVATVDRPPNEKFYASSSIDSRKWIGFLVHLALLSTMVGWFSF